MPGRVLHVLSQRPSLTGSGVTLDALVRHAARAGWKQRVLCGVPASEARTEVGGLGPDAIATVRFGEGALPFAVPGMSDLMPYQSTRFSDLGEAELRAYREAWTEALRLEADANAPDVVHCHHVWLVSSLAKSALPGVPIVTHCHATGLRQMRLCPHLAAEVARGCAHNDRFVVLTAAHRDALCEAIGIEPARVTVVGAGFDEALFHGQGRLQTGEETLLYAGKLARSKGLPWLLDAVERLARDRPNMVLEVAGGGSGEEAGELLARIRRMAPLVRYRGRLEQPKLAELARSARLLVLPSLFEGLPLVVVEAAACGCRAVATRLPGIEAELSPTLGDALIIVDPPRLLGPDEPAPSDLPRFVDDLTRAIERGLDMPPLTKPPPGLARFSWAAVFARVERVWRELTTESSADSEYS